MSFIGGGMSFIGGGMEFIGIGSAQRGDESVREGYAKIKLRRWAGYKPWDGAEIGCAT